MPLFLPPHLGDVGATMDDDIDKRFAEMWRKARLDAGKTQKYIANAMGVSVRTVRNWESGYGCPTQKQGFQWFAKLGIQPLPYYLDLLYPSEFNNILSSEDEQRITNALIKFITHISTNDRMMLLYCCCGSHGSSPHSVLDMMCAYLHLPMQNRIAISNTIVNDYILADRTGHLVQPDQVLPEISLVEKAISRATEANVKGFEEYTSILDDE